VYCCSTAVGASLWVTADHMLLRRQGRAGCVEACRKLHLQCLVCFEGACLSPP
jgi:hypothetical protein